MRQRVYLPQTKGILTTATQSAKSSSVTVSDTARSAPPYASSDDLGRFPKTSPLLGVLVINLESEVVADVAQLSARKGIDLRSVLSLNVSFSSTTLGNFIVLYHYRISVTMYRRRQTDRQNTSYIRHIFVSHSYWGISADHSNKEHEAPSHLGHRLR
jgi:hypothetical protein